MDPSTLLGPIDMLAPYIEYIVFVLIIANMATRHLQHRQHKQSAAAGAETLSRHPVHVASNVALLLGTFYLLSVDYHGGVVLTVLVIALIITDQFEVESRMVELRNDEELELPKAAIFTSGIVFLYAFYLSVFFVVEPAWRLVF